MLKKWTVRIIVCFTFLSFGIIVGQWDAKCNFYGVAQDSSFFKEGIEYIVTPLRFNYIEVKTETEGPRIVDIREDIVGWLNDNDEIKIKGKFLSRKNSKGGISYYNYID